MNVRDDRNIDPAIRLGIRCIDRLTAALFLVCAFGLYGVGIDLDHIPSYLYILRPANYPAFAGIGGRFAHRALLFAPGILCVGLGSYALGRVAGMVMEMRQTR